MALDFKHSLNHIWKLHVAKHLSEDFSFQLGLEFVLVGLLGIFLKLLRVCQNVHLMQIKRKEKGDCWGHFRFWGMPINAFSKPVAVTLVWNGTKWLYFTVPLAIYKQLLTLCTFSTSTYQLKVLGSNTMTQGRGTTQPVRDINFCFISYSHHCMVPSRVGKTAFFCDILKPYVPPVTSDLNLVKIWLAINI